jgi:hypothetical protein
MVREYEVKQTTTWEKEVGQVGVEAEKDTKEVQKYTGGEVHTYRAIRRLGVRIASVVLVDSKSIR